MKDLTKAKEMLCAGGYTCVMCRKDSVYTSAQRGVKPLVAWLESGQRFRDYCAADKVVGRATAFLYSLLGVKAVYARIISRCALQVLDQHGIVVEYDELVPNIINRQGDGVCPFEAAVLAITEPVVAYRAICAKMQELNITI